MQAISLSQDNCGYKGGVNTGRPSKHPRSNFGIRLHRLREEAGLSQTAIAERLSIPQRTYAYWERADVALRADQLAALAEIFDISCDHLIGREPGNSKGKGPSGKLKKVFEQASGLPRRQQKRVVDIVEDMLIAQEAKAS
jgi:transcriptional regulator with XRE-family HTH domain